MVTRITGTRSFTSSNRSSYECRYPNEAPKLVPAEKRAVSAGAVMPKSNGPQNEGGLHTIGSERMQVSILPRPDDTRGRMTFPDRNTEDLRVKGKGRTLGEYLKETERATLAGECQGIPGPSQVMVAKPSSNPVRGGGRQRTMGVRLIYI